MEKEPVNVIGDLVEAFFAAFSIEEKGLQKITNPILSVKESYVISMIHILGKSNQHTSTKIAQRTLMHPASLSIILRTLESKGYVYREHSKEDRRIVYVYLTELGKKVITDHKVFQDRLLEKMMKTLSPIEKAIAAKSVKRMRDFFVDALEDVDIVGKK